MLIGVVEMTNFIIIRWLPNVGVQVGVMVDIRFDMLMFTCDGYWFKSFLGMISFLDDHFR